MENTKITPVFFSDSSSEVITKKMLALVIGMKPRTFTKFLTALEPELKKVNPRYNKNCSILLPKEADLIAVELGLDLQEVRAKHKNLINPNRNKQT